MSGNKRVIVFLLINFVLCGILGFLIWNKLYGHKDHGEEEYIEKYNIQCDEGNHIESFYHDPSRRHDLVPMEEFYTLDIYCVDENNVKNGIFYKFAGKDFILQKGYFLNGEMDGERYLGMYDEVTHYKNGKRDGIETGYHTDGSLRYTGAYVDGKNEGQWTFYNTSGSISTMRIYSGGDMIERKEFYEDGKIKYECLNGGGCMDYDENGKITRKTPNNYRDYSGEEFRTYPNGQLEKVANYIDGKRDGRYTEYYENGQISYQCNYKLGKEDRCVSYDENGELKHETRYYKGTACSKEVYDDRMGKDSGNGLFTGYYENGQVSYTCNYISGQEEGRCVHYKRNGEIEDEGWHHKGYVYSKARYESVMRQENLANKPYNGPFTGYYEDGKIYYTCSYIQGQEEGRCVYYTRDGEVEREERYHEGNRINESMYKAIIKQEQDKLARKNIIDVGTGKGNFIYNSNANISYIDTEGYEFKGIGTITYSDQEGNSITMLDRNLGATKSGTGEDSYGYYFGWGNNYGFKNGGDISNKGMPNGYSRNNPYVSKDTNLEGTYNSNHRNLWGGTDDNEGNLRNPDVDNGYMRQGPCPAGYHIPSVGEWTKLINIWFKHEHGVDIEYIDGMFYSYYGDLVDKFTRDFKLPYAGSRVDDIGKKGQYRGSSLGKEPYNFAYELRLYPKKEIDTRTGETPHTIVLGGSSLGWWAKLSVRCFKDEYKDASSVITLKYETNGGTKIQSQTLPKGSVGFLPGYTTHKTGFELEGWYLDAGFTKKYDFSTKLDNDTIIYAKWKKSENKKNNKGTGFRLTDDEIRDYYYYNCTCPKGYSYTPEVVTYGDPGCEIKICENGNNCMTYSTSVNATCNKKLNINEIGSRVPMGSKDVENDYKRNCVCPTGFEFVKKTADRYADSCDRKYCVDSECKEIKTWHIWVKNLCKN